MWEIEFYTTENDAVPVSDFIATMDAKTQAKIFREIELLEELGIGLRMPHSRPLEDGLFELRITFRDGIVRVLYFHYEKKKFVLLHGFIKKTEKTPEREIAIATKYMKDYRRRNQ